VFVVGPPRPVSGDVTWVADLHPGGGPASGIWSGLPHVGTEYVFVTASDQNVTREQVQSICDAAVGHDGAWAIRPDGSGQPLCACVKAQVLREILAPTFGVNQSPLRLLQGRDMVGVTVTELHDVDTWNDVRTRALMDGIAMTQLWLDHLAQVLGVESEDVPMSDLLDLTREVAHTVERKAAPLTGFMLGLALGSGQRSIDEIMAATRIALSEWKPDASQ
jgi:molybdopterin-guanine dinucleotide biosynthesis protein A